MQGLILAAGMGKRLKELTQNNTKCMVKVNGVALIDRMLHQLDVCGLERIVIVVGYEGQKLIDYIGTLSVATPIVYVENPVYDKTNNIYSLFLARDKLEEDDTLLLESDVIFEDSILQKLLGDPRPTLALVDKYESWMDGTCVKLSEDDRIEAFVPGSKFVFADIPEYYKTVNLYKFSREFSQKYYVPFLEAYSQALGNNEYYEQVLRVITMLDDPQIRAKKLSGEKWYEIDDEQDLDIASSMFAPTWQEKLRTVQSRYGGYWRYPHLLDFCYLVNPYYPPRRLVDEMQASFETLLTQYPSGMQVNSLLVAKNFGIHREHIVVGNGAAELIKCLVEKMEGPTGVVRPTFEEYPHRMRCEEVVFTPDNADYRYTADDLMAFFTVHPVKNLILINPDNPSGNYIPKADVLRLAQWCRERNICFVLDESFVDFADEEDSTCIHEPILRAYPNMLVMKSISKSYGVPGVRLGVLASADESRIATMKKEVAIWNINSFGEFYMQIAEKYNKDYRAALVQLRQERRRFQEALAALPGLRVIPSQANYVMVELLDGRSATELTARLLEKDVLVKDLSAKLSGKTYLRLAVRNTQDNDRLLAALREAL